jgi:predicted kinase
VCSADPEIARQRLARRQGDISAAAYGVRERQAKLWEDLGPVSRRQAVELRANGEAGDLLQRAREAIASIWS